MITTEIQVGKGLKTAVSETFEGLAFVEFDEAKYLEDMPRFDDDYLVTTITINEPENGKIALLCKRQFANETYESVTGEFLDGNSTDPVDDSLNEIVNTLAGRFVASLLNEGEDFVLGLPITEKIADSNLDYWATSNAVIIEFTTMQEKLFCLLKLEEQ